MLRFYILLLSLFTFLSVNRVQSQVSNPTGTLHDTTEDEIWPHTLTGSHYNEFWNYQFYLNGDITVHITFSVADFGSLKSAVSGVQVSIYNLEGQLYQLSREYDIEHLVLDKEKFIFRNRMEREIFFEGKLPDAHRIRIQTTKNDVAYDIDLSLSNIQDGFKWGNGKYHIGSEEVGIITHIPYSEVSGYIEVNGVRKSAVGTAYMDHTFQNQTTTNLMNSGYRYIHHNSPNEWDLIYFMLPNNSTDQKTIGYRVEKSNGNLNLNGIEQIIHIDKSQIFDENVAQVIEVKFSDGHTTQILRTENHEKFSVLSELGRLARSVARRFLGGEVIHFRGEATLLEPAKRRKDGYYNFFIIN
tara:strand:+ start:28042 stop:29109 length:1068 start_codon:yes stop_codon:yes gene_type:complete